MKEENQIATVISTAADSMSKLVTVMDAHPIGGSLLACIIVSIAIVTAIAWRNRKGSD